MGSEDFVRGLKRFADLWFIIVLVQLSHVTRILFSTVLLYIRLIPFCLSGLICIIFEFPGSYFNVNSTIS